MVSVEANKFKINIQEPYGVQVNQEIMMKSNSKKDYPNMFFDGLACSDETLNSFIDYTHTDEFLELEEEEQINAALSFGEAAGSIRVCFNERVFALDEFCENWEEITQL